MWAMLALLVLLVLSCPGVARDVSRAHLGRGSALSRAPRVRGFEHGPIVRRGGVGGRRGAGERRARARSMAPYRFYDSSQHTHTHIF